ncbi:transglycosylase domain-containing protein [Aestuariispira insulae]|nr:PBP1A family penicillin-binding protein [Aestuariispira insulae]
MAKQKRVRKNAATTNGRAAGQGRWAARWRWFKRLLALSIWLMIAGAGLLLWYAWDLPNPDEIIARTTRKPIITVLAANGVELARHGDDYGEAVNVADLPPYLPRAFLATEDRRFYDHQGVDPIGLARALVTNLMAGGVRQGGSTISQQLAKNLFLSPERTVRRKVQEVLLAFWLEHKLTKDQILSVYLNRIYLGSGTYGVDAAARKYFGRSAKQVTLYQAAVLAGLPKAPSRYSPLASSERSAARANQVLDNLVAAGWLDAKTAQTAKRKQVAVAARPAGRNVRYFTDWAVARATALVGRPDRDMIIHTTLMPAHQRAAERAVASLKNKAASADAGQLAYVAMRPDGAVTAMLGGKNWSASTYNRAVHAQRQPGSAFKPFVFLAGLENGFTPDSIIDDRAITVEGWSPRNASGTHRGEMTLREGAARSSNSVAVALMEQVGRGKVIQAARRLGISTPMEADPALALGVHEVTLLELTAAYSVFANGGRSVWPYAIERVTDAAGAVLFQSERTTGALVVEPVRVAQMGDLLRAVVAWGTGKRAGIDGRVVRGKTGTTQNYRDAWFIGYADDLVAGVWFGNDDSSPMKNVGGGNLPAQLWSRSVSGALEP